MKLFPQRCFIETVIRDIHIEMDIFMTSLALRRAIVDAGGDPELTRNLVGELEERAREFAEDIECE